MTVGHKEINLVGGACAAGCRLSCVLETVAGECDGRRKCSVDAISSVFGNRCLPGATKFLAILHTCGE